MIPVRTETVALVGGSGMAGGAEMFNVRLADHLEMAGLAVRRLPLNSYLRRGWLILRVWVWLWSVLVALVRIMLHRPDHVVISCANFPDIVAARLVAAVTRRAKLTVIAHFNASWMFWQSVPLAGFARRASVRFRLFSIAPAQRRFFVEQGLCVEKSLFPNFFNYRAHAGRAEKCGPAGNAVVALYVGRIVAEKHVDQVAAYLARLADPSLPVVLRLVGECAEPFHVRLAAFRNDHFAVEPCGVQDSLGVSRQMTAADFLISFSGSDTMPLTYLEAAAHGLQVVTLDNPVTRDVQSMTGNVVFVDPGADADAARRTLRQVAGAPRLGGIDDLIEANGRRVLNLIRSGAAAVS